MKSLLCWNGGKILSKITKMLFWTGISFFGPGAIISVIGMEGLIAVVIITHSGIVEYTGKKIISKL